MEEFRRNMRGEVLEGSRPSDRAKMWPPLVSMPENWPKLVCYPTDASDVIECVKFARLQGLRVSIFYSGDRNTSSLAQTLHGPIMLVVLERTMKSITIDGDIASVEPGATGEELLEATTRLGFALPVPFCSREPLGAFLISGGAVGWGCQALGPAASHVVAVDLVTPDGKLVRADHVSKDRAELLWATRGAGYGFFGVPLRWHLRLAPLPRSIVAMSLRFPLDALAEITRWVEGVHPSLPRTVELTLRVGHSLDTSLSNHNVASLSNAGPGGVPPSPGFSPAPTPVVRTYSGEDPSKLPELVLPRASSLDPPVTPAKTPKTPSRRRSFRPVAEVYLTAVAFEDDPGRADSALAPLIGCPVGRAHFTIPLGFEYAQLWELSDRFYPATLGCAATDNLWTTVAPSVLAARLAQRINKAPSLLSSFLMLFHAPGRAGPGPSPVNNTNPVSTNNSDSPAAGGRSNTSGANAVVTSSSNNSLSASMDSPSGVIESFKSVSISTPARAVNVTHAGENNKASGSNGRDAKGVNNGDVTSGDARSNRNGDAGTDARNHPSAPRGALGLPGFAATYVGCYSFWAEEAGNLPNAGWLVDSARDLQPYAVGHYIGEANLEIQPGNTRAVTCFSPSSWSRLEALRGRVDPGGLFSGYAKGGSGKSLLETAAKFSVATRIIPFVSLSLAALYFLLMPQELGGLHKTKHGREAKVAAAAEAAARKAAARK